MSKPMQMLFIPDELNFGDDRPPADALLAALVEEYQNRQDGTSDGELPIIVAAPRELIAQIRLFTFDGTMPVEALRAHADQASHPDAAHRLVDEFLASAERLSQCGIIFAPNTPEV